MPTSVNHSNHSFPILPENTTQKNTPPASYLLGKRKVQFPKSQNLSEFPAEAIVELQSRIDQGRLFKNDTETRKTLPPEPKPNEQGMTPITQPGASRYSYIPLMGAAEKSLKGKFRSVVTMIRDGTANDSILGRLLQRVFNYEADEKMAKREQQLEDDTTYAQRLQSIEDEAFARQLEAQETSQLSLERARQIEEDAAFARRLQAQEPSTFVSEQVERERELKRQAEQIKADRIFAESLQETPIFLPTQVERERELKQQRQTNGPSIQSSSSIRAR